MNIFVAKLDYSTTVDTVRELFEQFGEVSDAKIVMDRETGRSKGFGFIEMEEDAGWDAIRELNGSDLDGREIVVKKSEPRENNNRGGGGGGFRKRFDRNDNRGGGNRYDSRGGGGDRYNRRDDNRDRNNRW